MPDESDIGQSGCVNNPSRTSWQSGQVHEADRNGLTQRLFGFFDCQDISHHMPASDDPWPAHNEAGAHERTVHLDPDKRPPQIIDAHPCTRSLPIPRHSRLLAFVSSSTSFAVSGKWFFSLDRGKSHNQSRLAISGTGLPISTGVP